jgi:uncharacterized membrane protein
MFPVRRSALPTTRHETPQPPQQSASGRGEYLAWVVSGVLVTVFVGGVLTLLIVEHWTAETAITAVVGAGIGAVEVLRRVADVVRDRRVDRCGE